MGRRVPREVGGDCLSTLGGQVHSELPNLQGPKGIRPLTETGNKAHHLDFGSVSDQIALSRQMFICLIDIYFFIFPLLHSLPFGNYELVLSISESVSVLLCLLIIIVRFYI